MKQIGFMGLGVMGLPMAIHLTKKSQNIVKGFDVFENRRELFAQQGGFPLSNQMELIEESDIIFLCLPTNQLVEETVDYIIKYGKEGAIIVDNSSTSPKVIQRLCEKAKEAGKTLLDAPVSGGETGAMAGTLVIMCGGNKDKFQEVLPDFQCMAKEITYMGESGCGSITKLVNNMMVGIHLGALGEAFAFGAKAGIDPQTLFQAISHGFAQSAVMDIKAPKLLKGDYSPSARTAVHQKDLKNAMELAGELGVSIPLSAMVLDGMNQLEAQGDIHLDHCAVAKIYEQNMGVSIKDAVK